MNSIKKYEHKHQTDSVFHFFFICQDLLYNSGKSSGFIFNTLAYRKKRAKSLLALEGKIDVTQALEACSIHEEREEGEELTEDEINKILAYFKSCLVKEEQPELIEKMKKTRMMRSNICFPENTTYKKLSRSISLVLNL